MKAMTSRERVLAALDRREPDRVPVDIGGGTSTSIVAEAYDNLKRHLGIEAENRLLSRVYRSARLDAAVMERLGSDCYPLRAGSPMKWQAPPSEPGTYIDAWGVKWRQVIYASGSFYWEVAASPLAEATLANLDRYAWPDPTDVGYVAGVADEAKTLHEGSPYAVEASCGFYSLWEVAYALRGFQQLLMDLATEPEFVAALLGRIHAINLEGTRRFLDAAGPYIDIFRMADDLASQKAPLMSPGTFRRQFKPLYREYIASVRARTPARIVFHSDGNVVPLLDDLIEVGVDALNPVQPSALGDTAVLKARFGDRLGFVGGVDTQEVLPHGTPERVRAEVRRRIRDLAPGGGYILAAVHSIQMDVPPENILAMADAAREFGRYPISRDDTG